jgi:hypothetical protein
MTKKEFQKRRNEVRALYEEGKQESAEQLALELVDDLYADKNYALIAELYHSRFLEPKYAFWTFEVAYALSEQQHQSEAEQIYEHIVSVDPTNSAALNREFGNSGTDYEFLSHWRVIRKRVPTCLRSYLAALVSVPIFLSTTQSSLRTQVKQSRFSSRAVKPDCRAPFGRSQ